MVLSASNMSRKAFFQFFIACWLLPSVTGCIAFVPLTDTSQPDPEEARIEAAKARYYSGTPTPTRRQHSKGNSSMLTRFTRELSDKNAAKRTSAASYLGLMGEAAGPAVPDLVRALNDPSHWVRRASARALGRIGRPALPAVGALKVATRDSDPYVARTAKLALQKLSAL